MGALETLGNILVGAANGGQMQNQNTPSALLEWQAYQAMPDKQKLQYLNMKRAVPPLNQGDQFGTYDPITNQVIPLAPINPRVAEMPKFQAAQQEAKKNVDLRINPQIAGAEAAQRLKQELNYSPQIKQGEAEGSAKGKIKGEQIGAQEKKTLQAPATLDILNQIEELLPKATSGGLNTLGKNTAQFFNSATEGSKIDAQIEPLASALLMNVPRFEGPQGVRDVEEYQKAAGNLANTNLPFETRLAAVSKLKEINQKYVKGNFDNSPSSSKITPEQALKELKRRGKL